METTPPEDGGGPAARKGERDLLERALGGDARSFGQIVELERELLLHQIDARMGPGLRALYQAEDILQDALVRALGALPRFRANSRGELRAWMMTIARNRILDIHRGSLGSSRPWGKTALPAGQLVFQNRSPVEWEAADKGRGAEERLLSREAADRALSLVNRLHADQRLCVVLRDLLGLPWSTVTFVLDRSQPAARKLYQRARGSLERGTRAESEAACPPVVRELPAATPHPPATS